MSDPTTVLPPELADIGLVAFADANFCERLPGALDGMADGAPPAPSPQAGAHNARDLAA